MTEKEQEKTNEQCVNARPDPTVYLAKMAQFLYSLS